MEKRGPLIAEKSVDDPWTVDLEPFDLHDALGVTASGADGEFISGGEARVLSRFYDLATLIWPAAAHAGYALDEGSDVDVSAIE